MKTAATTLQAGSLPKTYEALVALHPPRIIHNGVSYTNAVEIVHALAGFKLNRDQRDYLDLMSKLIEDYERANSPEPQRLAPHAALAFLLSENAMSADDLGHLLGVDRSIAYRILKGTRNLTAEHIKKLAARFAVSADLFL
jgi:HTH-type transcriptional regulator/antitoxin HigA